MSEAPHRTLITAMNSCASLVSAVRTENYARGDRAHSFGPFPLLRGWVDLPASMRSDCSRVARFMI